MNREVGLGTLYNYLGGCYKGVRMAAIQPVTNKGKGCGLRLCWVYKWGDVGGVEERALKSIGSNDARRKRAPI